MTSTILWFQFLIGNLRPSRVIERLTPSDCQCQSRNNPGFDPSILRHNRIWRVADKAMFDKVHFKKYLNSLPVNFKPINR